MTLGDTGGGFSPRSVCDFGLDRLPSVSPERRWADVLEPGDVLFFRTEHSLVSRVICLVDGYWSHTAIYLGDDRIAHTTMVGLRTDSLRDFATGYNDGIAFARPPRTKGQREAAAAWAEDKAGKEAAATGFAGDHLGVSLGLLLLPRIRAVLREVPGLDLKNIRRFDWSVARRVAAIAGLGGDPDRFDGTCSGFVYRAYSEGAGAPLEISTVPGLDRRGEQIYLSEPNADNARWMEGLGGSEPPARFEDEPDPVIDPAIAWAVNPNVKGTDLKQVTNPGLLQMVLTFVPAAVFGFAKVYVTDLGVEVADAVTPGDLWLSPEPPTTSGFLTEHHRREAEHEIEIADC